MRFRNPLPSAGSSAVMKKNGIVASSPRTMSRKSKPSMSPIMISEMIALKAWTCAFRIVTASSTEDAVIGTYPAFFNLALTVRRINRSSSTTRMTVFSRNLTQKSGASEKSPVFNVKSSFIGIYYTTL